MIRHIAVSVGKICSFQRLIVFKEGCIAHYQFVVSCKSYLDKLRVRMKKDYSVGFESLNVC